jgi:hypothetical protein
MPRPIRYRCAYPVAADELYATLVSRKYLEAKLAEIGGQNAALVDLAADADAAKCQLRQGVSQRHLPGAVQKILRGDLIIERSETWRKTAPDRYEGTISARVKDAPGSIGGALLIERDGGAGSAFQISGDVKIDVPFVGGKIESAVADQILRLMEREAAFTQDWLAR